MSGVGARVARYRRMTGRSQAVVAGLCGVTERYLSLIENGHRTPSSDVLVRLARELAVPVAALLCDEMPRSRTTALTADEGVVRALLGGVQGGQVLRPRVLRARVEAAWHTWQTSAARYTETEPRLSQLILDTEATTRGTTEAPDRRQALRSAADLYSLLRSYCRRAGRLDLALLVADRSRRAAEDADDVIRRAAAAWNLGHCLLSQQDGSEAAIGIARAGIAALDEAPPSIHRTAMTGALELVHVTADAQRRRWWQARARLETCVFGLADEAGEGNVMRTVFGPANTRLHALSLEVLAGEGARGLRLGSKADVRSLPSRERQFTFLLDMARGYCQRREDPAALAHLLELERISAEDMIRNSAATDAVTVLLDRARPAGRPQAEALAQRLGLV
ncbi:transcriptional regulator [Streptomyces albidoflavus]|nr:transcriptional regulator [Streptomyces albidoflavus]